MILSAYPNGISEDVYWALLELLGENMSIRALPEFLRHALHDHTS